MHILILICSYSKRIIFAKNIWILCRDSYVSNIQFSVYWNVAMEYGSKRDRQNTHNRWKITLDKLSHPSGVDFESVLTKYQSAVYYHRRIVYSSFTKFWPTGNIQAATFIFLENIHNRESLVCLLMRALFCRTRRLCSFTFGCLWDVFCCSASPVQSDKIKYLINWICDSGSLDLHFMTVLSQLWIKWSVTYENYVKSDNFCCSLYDKIVSVGWSLLKWLAYIYWNN